MKLFCFTRLMNGAVDGSSGGGNAGNAGDNGAGGGGSGGGGNSPASTDFRAFVGDKGELKPGWSKAIGAPEDFEKKYTSVEAAFKAHGSLVQMLGRDKVPVPTENSTEDEWNQFYAKTGRPEKPDGYGLKKPDDVPAELWSDERMKSFSETAHKLGLNTKQVQELLKWELANVTGQAAAYKQGQETAQQEVVAGLKKEWGANYDAKIKSAQSAARSLGYESMLTDQVLGNHPEFLRALAKMGEMIGEGAGIAGGRSAQGAGSSPPKEEIDRIMADKNDPYWQKTHPQHESRMTYVAGLYAKAYPAKA